MGHGHGFGQKLLFLILKSLPVAVDWWQSVVFDERYSNIGPHGL